MGTLAYLDTYPEYLSRINGQRTRHGLQCMIYPPEKLAEKAMDRARRAVMQQINAGEIHLSICCWTSAQARQLIQEIDKLMAFRGYTTTAYNVARRKVSYSFQR